MLQEAQTRVSASTNMAEEKAGPVMQPSATNSGHKDAQEQEVASNSVSAAAAHPAMPASSATFTANSQQV